MGSVIPVLYQQAVPVFADLGEGTYNLDVAAFATAQVVVAHLAGAAGDQLQHHLAHIVQLQMGIHPGIDFFHLEGFGNIIHATTLQRADFIFRVAQSTDKNNRHIFQTGL